MAQSSQGGAAARRSAKDKARAAYMKRLGIERTTGRCAQCYRIITINSSKSRYTHICRG
jgi:hypothetical protein